MDGSDSDPGDAANDSLVAEVARRLVVSAELEPWPDKDAIEASERYRVEELVGEGGMARVYRAFDRVLGRTVALKLLRDPTTAPHLLREARAQAKVEHEHICRIYEVGELAGRPFIAMQYVAGTSLRDAGSTLSLRVKVSVIRDVALAVHAAHRIGLIHRDLKPSNILVELADGGDPRSYVVDFGIARDVGQASSTGTQVVGTPQYMSPEQALGHVEELDRRTDIYSLGATLYELAAGVPPFSGIAATEILLKVSADDPPPLRRHDRRLPVDLETIVMTCLRRDPAERYDSARALAEDLQRFLDGEPVLARRASVWTQITSRVRKHKALSAALALAIVATSAAGIAVHVAATRERAARAAALVDEAEHALAIAHFQRGAEDALRRRAFELFDDDRDREADLVWTQALATHHAVELAYDHAGRALEAALAWDPDRARARARFASHLLERAHYAERDDDRAQRDDFIERLAFYDADGTYQRRWRAPAVLAIATEPAGAEVAVSRYEADARGTLVEVDARPLGTTPLAHVELSPGSYVLRLAAPGRTSVRYPVLLGRGEPVSLAVTLPPADRIPNGFVYIPPGQFLVGAREARRRLLLAPPLHAHLTGAYLIGRTQVTIAEWLEFLATLPPAERARRTPGATGVERGSVSLVELGPGSWEYRFQSFGNEHTYVARTGELLHYGGRTARAVQDWTRFPVTGISTEDAEAYAAWLDRSGRLPGARLCTGAERERAARGADTREYPRGRQPAPDETNILQTYGGAGAGLDEVGSHPASRSPFDVDDLVGNASDWTEARPGASASDRGAYYAVELFARSQVNAHNPDPRDLRSPGVGMRLCATFGGP